MNPIPGHSRQHPGHRPGDRRRLTRRRSASAGFTTEGSIPLSISSLMKALSVAVLVMAVVIACFAGVF
ncbi:hypothetical protein [Streptosporangium carneum]|uniref:hypothetical protein n=1 Tax=Streptosporangium carneum TaxID=47481 RepID=UPI0022F32244|nr:hypothetical protein [Streptosporangium carneum]